MIKQESISSENQELLKKIGGKLKQLREQKGSRNYIMAAKAIGISRNTYNLLEMGKINFQFTTLYQVLIYYNVTLSDFFRDLQ